VASQTLLLLFAWQNRDQPGFWSLGLGVALNLLVMATNGGLMPIRPEIVAELLPNASPDVLQDGCRLGKNVVLTAGAMRLDWLSDRFLLPSWFPGRVAFSLGDAFIAGGAFWLLWTLADPDEALGDRPSPVTRVHGT
jgi:hypothetical protein